MSKNQVLAVAPVVIATLLIGLFALSSGFLDDTWPLDKKSFEWPDGWAPSGFETAARLHWQAALVTTVIAAFSALVLSIFVSWRNLEPGQRISGLSICGSVCLLYGVVSFYVNAPSEETSGMLITWE